MSPGCSLDRPGVGPKGREGEDPWVDRKVDPGRSKGGSTGGPEDAPVRKPKGGPCVGQRLLGPGCTQI